MAVKIDDETGLPVIERGAPAPSYQDRRGKQMPKAQAAWSSRTAHGSEFDPSQGDKLLDEALK